MRISDWSSDVCSSDLFCMDRRDEVIDYVAAKYGRDRVSQIITYGTMAAKAVVRDTGRVLGFPYGFVDGIAKLVPMTLGLSLDDALGRTDKSRSDDKWRSDELIARYTDEDEVPHPPTPAPQTEALPLHTRQPARHRSRARLPVRRRRRHRQAGADDAGHLARRRAGTHRQVAQRRQLALGRTDRALQRRGRRPRPARPRPAARGPHPQRRQARRRRGDRADAAVRLLPAVRRA